MTAAFHAPEVGTVDGRVDEVVVVGIRKCDGLAS